VGDEEGSSEDAESTEETSSSDEEEEDEKGEVRSEEDGGRGYTAMCSVLTPSRHFTLAGHCTQVYITYGVVHACLY